ncbi:hypothetical protein H4S07_003334, partial [Coemansia furcata]
MDDNSRRRDAYRLPGIKALTGSPPRPTTGVPLSQDGHQQPQGLPPPYYDPQRSYLQQSVPPVPPVSHHSQYPQHLPPPPQLPRPPHTGSSRHGAPLPRSSVGSHDYSAPPRPEYPPYQQQPHYPHVQPHAHAYAAPGHPHHGYPYSDKPAKYGEHAPPPPHSYHQASSGRPGGAYPDGFTQKHAIDSAQPSPGAGPMDMAGMVYSQPRHAAIPSPEQATSPTQAYQSHYHPLHPGVSPHPLMAAGTSQHSPLPRQSQQTMHSPHYTTYSSYASTARESPATNTASYDAYGVPATLPPAPSDASSVVEAVDARLASRIPSQKQLAPALANRPAIHAPAPPKLPPPPPPPPSQPLVTVTSPALGFSLPPAVPAPSAHSANVSKSS